MPGVQENISVKSIDAEHPDRFTVLQNFDRVISVERIGFAGGLVPGELPVQILLRDLMRFFRGDGHGCGVIDRIAHHPETPAHHSPSPHLPVFLIPHHIRALFREYGQACRVNQKLHRANAGALLGDACIGVIVEDHDFAELKVRVIQPLQVSLDCLFGLLHGDRGGGVRAARSISTHHAVAHPEIAAVAKTIAHHAVGAITVGVKGSPPQEKSCAEDERPKQDPPDDCQGNDQRLIHLDSLRLYISIQIRLL
jgi:hypothetical protein